MSKVKKVISKVKEGYLKEAGREILWSFAYVKQYRLAILLYTFLSLLSVGLGLVLSVQIKEVVNALVSMEISALISIGIFYFIVGSCNIALTLGTQIMAGIISNRAKYQISNEIYHKILISDWEELTEYHSGDFLNRMNEDISSLTDSFVGWIPGLLSKGLQIGASFLLIIYYDASMLLIFLVAAPIILFGSRLFMGKTFLSNKKARVIASRVSEFRNETFHNIQTIKAFHLIDRFDERMVNLQKEKCDIDIEVNRYSVSSWAVMYLSGQIAAIVCLAWGIYHVYSGTITLGTLSLMFIMASNIATSFKAMIQLVPKAVTTITSVTRIRNITEMKEESSSKEEAATRLLEKSRNQGLSLGVEDLHFHYRNGKIIFEHVSFSVKPGEIAALVGPSGEGKTTMLRIILGIVRWQSGKAFFSLPSDQQDSIEISPATREFIAYVPQEKTMLAMTIAENMRLVKEDATEEEIIEALQSACAYEFVQKLPDTIHHKIGEGGSGFSEGQNQRLSIARALLCDAPVLLLDEATSALDVATERRVLKNIMQKNPHKMCILTTHRPSVLSMCDKVYKISEQSVRQIYQEEITALMDGF